MRVTDSRHVASQYPPISDYALIGDCHTAALIARDGSIDWWCPGRFDAPAVFCRVLDAQRGGFLRSAPTGHFSTQRRYCGATNVLETTLASDGGRIRLTDFMSLDHRLMRRVQCVDGEVEIAVEFKPTFDFARTETQLNVRDEGATAHAGEHYLTLTSRGVHLEPSRRATATGRLTLRAGEERWLVLASARDVESDDAQEQLRTTLKLWEDWAARCTYHGPYRDQVLRSALVLKLLTYEPSGAVVAAPTSSLPESVGGERNWDYRFTWLRDSSLILYALVTIGYDAEATDFMQWLERTVGADPSRRPQIMYGIDGERHLPEQVLDHLDGYRSSRPVRIGNAAANQVQLDIYGEVLRGAAVHYHNSRPHRPSPEAWRVLRELVDQAAQGWQQAGSGIWEVRGGPEHFLYGKLMCWAALDAGLRLARNHHLDAPVERWERSREQIRHAIIEHGYNRRLRAFTQAFDSSSLDASALVIPRIGFLPPTDPRVQSTVDQIAENLSQDGLIYRYRTEDGLAGGEGTFTLCTFWLVDALALGGRLDEARALFERTLTCANDLGLLSEEIDARTGEQLGNFPQGFSHLALIGAAVNLAKVAAHGSEEQAEDESDRAAHAQAASG